MLYNKYFESKQLHGYKSLNKAEQMGEWHRGCPAENQLSKAQWWAWGSSFQSNVYLTSETSPLYWKSELRNVWGQPNVFLHCGMRELLHGQTHLRGVCHQGKSQSICAALFNAIREVFLLAGCCFLHFCRGQVARCQSIMQILHAMLQLSMKCFRYLA